MNAARELLQRGARWDDFLNKLGNRSDAPAVAERALQAHLASWYDAANDSNVCTEEDVALIQRLLATGLRPDGNMVRLAAEQWKFKTVSLLLDTGAPAETAASGNTALMACSYAGDIRTMRELLERGAHIDAQDELGWTPLMHAMWREQVEPVEFLLSAGARVDVKNERGQNVLEMARARLRERAQFQPGDAEPICRIVQVLETASKGL